MNEFIRQNEKKSEKFVTTNTRRGQQTQPTQPSVPLTPSETASLRKEMSEAMDWAEKELKKDQAAS